jgi:hypothetical protein
MPENILLSLISYIQNNFYRIYKFDNHIIVNHFYNVMWDKTDQIAYFVNFLYFNSRNILNINITQVSKIKQKN